MDEADTLPREYRAPISYEFDPDRFEDVTTPTLLLVGGASPQWAKDAVTMIHDVIPQSRIAILEGQGTSR